MDHPTRPPQNFDDVQATILDRHATLPKRLAQAARYALEHPDDVAFGTAASLAAASGVQPSTLVRLAHNLGFRGFSELQSIFRERLRGRVKPYDERLDFAGSGRDAGDPGAVGIASGILAAAVSSIEKVGRELDGATLERAAAVLAGAETIYVLAQRRAYPAASYLGYIFGKLRMRAVVAGSQAGIDEDMLELAGPGDAAVSISFTPYASTTVAWTRILTRNSVPVIGITDSAFSPIASLSSHWIEVAEPDFEGFRSLSAAMALSASLAVAAARTRRAAEQAPAR